MARTTFIFLSLALVSGVLVVSLSSSTDETIQGDDEIEGAASAAAIAERTRVITIRPIRAVMKDRHERKSRTARAVQEKLRQLEVEEAQLRKGHEASLWEEYETAFVEGNAAVVSAFFTDPEVTASIVCSSIAVSGMSGAEEAAAVYSTIHRREPNVRNRHSVDEIDLLLWADETQPKRGGVQGNGTRFVLADTDRRLDACANAVGLTQLSAGSLISPQDHLWRVLKDAPRVGILIAAELRRRSGEGKARVASLPRWLALDHPAAVPAFSLPAVNETRNRLSQLQHDTTEAHFGRVLVDAHPDAKYNFGPDNIFLDLEGERIWVRNDTSAMIGVNEPQAYPEWLRLYRSVRYQNFSSFCESMEFVTGEGGQRVARMIFADMRLVSECRYPGNGHVTHFDLRCGRAVQPRLLSVNRQGPCFVHIVAEVAHACHRAE